ncbi:hypothetical protein CSUI_010686 [Cystoisospora suis]|uniref:Uncharacterized protein n=1 Tax=Cystoisospora suis TaxID=483139 RepID=A0A2C6KG33_9APIC|nr:hypothetical protein CSUI_010686 [Cystoisospora suis]
MSSLDSKLYGSTPSMAPAEGDVGVSPSKRLYFQEAEKGLCPSSLDNNIFEGYCSSYNGNDAALPHQYYTGPESHSPQYPVDTVNKGAYYDELHGKASREAVPMWVHDEERATLQGTHAGSCEPHGYRQSNRTLPGQTKPWHAESGRDGVGCSGDNDSQAEGSAQNQRGLWRPGSITEGPCVRLPTMKLANEFHRSSHVREGLRQKALSGGRTADLLRTPFDYDIFHRARLPPSVGARIAPAGKETDWGEQKLLRTVPPSAVHTSYQMAERLGRDVRVATKNAEERRQSVGSGNRRNLSGRLESLLRGPSDSGLAGETPLFAAKAYKTVDSTLLSRNGRPIKKLFPSRATVDSVSPLLRNSADSDYPAKFYAERTRSKGAHRRDSEDLRSIVAHQYCTPQELSGPEIRKACFRSSPVVATKNPYRWGVDVFSYQLPPPRRLRQSALRDHLDSTLVPEHSSDELDPRRKTATPALRGSLETSSLTPMGKATSLASGVPRARSAVACDGSLDSTLVPRKDDHQGRGVRPRPEKAGGHLRPDFIPAMDERQRCKRFVSTRDHLQRDLVPSTSPVIRNQKRCSSVARATTLQMGSLCPKAHPSPA